MTCCSSSCCNRCTSCGSGTRAAGGRRGTPHVGRGRATHSVIICDHRVVATIAIEELAEHVRLVWEGTNPTILALSYPVLPCITDAIVLYNKQLFTGGLIYGPLIFALLLNETPKHD